MKAVKDCGLKGIIKVNFYVVPFSGITLDLHDNIYEPHRKPDNHTVYISKSPNHPKTILRELPKSISKILSCSLRSEALKKVDLMSL